MNWNQIKVHWKQVSDRIKVTWGKLSEDDLAEIAGDRRHLAGLLQKRYGYDQVLAEQKVDAFALALSPVHGGPTAVGGIRS